MSELWEWSLNNTNDTELKARIIGVKTMMTKFDFLFGCIMGKTLLNQADNLSKTLQNPKLSALEAQTISRITIDTLKKDRNDAAFSLFWELVINTQKSLSVDDPVLPRQRKIPVRHDEFQSSAHFSTNVTDHYRAIYYECLDILVNVIEQRFNQSDYQIYLQMQEILLKAAQGHHHCYDDDVNMLAKNYSDDIDIVALREQLRLLTGLAERHGYEGNNINILDFIKFMQSLDRADREFISQVITLVVLVLLAPATNAVSERSFSGLKRLKTYMRSTMSDDRLLYLMMLHIHRDKCDEISVLDVSNKFVGGK